MAEVRNFGKSSSVRLRWTFTRKYRRLLGKVPRTLARDTLRRQHRTFVHKEADNALAACRFHRYLHQTGVSVGSLLPSAVESCARGEDNLRDRGVVVVGTVARATGKGDAMTSGNAGFFSGSGLREKTGLAGTSRQLRLRCADVHPVHCDAEWTAPSASELVAIAVEHGAHAHGFTPRWYTAERIAGISRGARG